MFSHQQEILFVAVGSSLATAGGFGSALVAYASELPNTVAGGAFFVGLAGVFTALTPLVVKAIEARKLVNEIAELRSEVVDLKDTVKDMAGALWVDRRWMIEAVARHPELTLPPGFAARSFDPKTESDLTSLTPDVPPKSFEDPDKVEE